MKTRTSLILIALAVLGLVAVQPARAATIYTWTNAAGGNWNTGTNWNTTPNVPTFAADDTADFSTLNITATGTVTIDGPAVTLGNLKFADATTVSNTWALAGTNTITFDTTSGSPTIDVRNLTGDLNVAATIKFAGNDGLTLTGDKSALFKVQNAGNTYTGGTIIDGGWFRAGASDGTTYGTLGAVTSTVTLRNGGRLAIADSDKSLSASRAIILDSGTQQLWAGSSKKFTINGNISGAGGFTTGDNGTFVLNGTLSYNGNTTINNTTTINGPSSGNGLITVAANALTMNAANTGNGGVTLSAGTLNINHAQALGTGTFTISGGTIDNTSGSAVTLSTVTPQAWNANVAFTGGSALNLGAGAVTLGGTYQIQVAANTLTVGGNIGDGSLGYGLNKLKSGTLVLTGTNTYTGDTKLGNFGDQEGVLRANNGAGLPAGSNLNIQVGAFETGSDLVRAGGTVAGQMQLTSAGSNNSGGFSAYGGPVKVCFGTLLSPTALTWGTAPFSPGNGTGGLILNHTTANNTLDFKNPVNLGTAVRIVNVNATDPAAIATMSGVLSSGAGGGLTKKGVGTLVLTNTGNSYSGATTVNAGTLRTGASNVLPNASNVTVSGTGAGVTATLDLVGNSDTIGTLSFGGSTTTSGAAVTTGAGTLTLGGDVTYTATNNPLGATISGNLDLGSATRTFAINDSTTAAKDLTVSAGISGSGVGLTKTQAGTLLLSGANTYTGVTTISAGNLTFAKRAALYNDTAASWTTANISVAASATLGLDVGAHASGYFDTTDLDTLLNGSHLGASTPTTGLQTSSILGLDTTYATSGAFTYNTAITNPGTALTMGFTKLGAGTLTLGGNNTYTGPTTVSAGTLVFSGNNSSASGATSVSAGATLRGVGANSLPTGTLTLAGGTLDLRADGSTFGNNLIVSASSTINVDRATGAGALNGTHTLGTMSIGGQTLTATGGNGYSLALGATTLTGAATFNPIFANMSLASVTVSAGNQNLILSGKGTSNTVGAITTGSGTLTKFYDDSIWTLSGSNTYTGATAINGGKLIVNGSTHATSAVTIGQSAFLGGTGTVNGNVTASNGGTNSNAYVPGGSISLVNGSVGTLAVGGNLTFNGAAATTANHLFFDLGNGAGGTDKIAVTGTFNTSATANTVRVFLNQLSGGAVDAGTYTLIQGGTAGANKNYALGSTRAGGNLYSALGVTGANLQVTVAAGTAGLGNNYVYWKGNSSSVWTGANWYQDSGGSTADATGPGYQSNVRFATSSPGNLTNTFGQDYEINSLTVDSGLAATVIGNSDTKMLTIDATSANGNTAGNGITVNNTAGTTISTTRIGLGSSQTWYVGTGASLAITAEIGDFGNGYTLTKDGPGDLTLNRFTTYTGGTVVNGGRLILTNPGIADMGAGLRGALTINANATVVSPATLGYGANGGVYGDQLSVININGGTLDRSGSGTNGNSTTCGITFNMTGGTMSHTGTGYWEFRNNLNNCGPNVFNILPSSNSSLISGRMTWSDLNLPFNVADGNAAVDLEISGHTGGGNGLIKNGPGLLALTANNSTTDAGVGIGHSGTTTINAGTLQLGTGGATGNLNPASAIVNNGTLAFNRNNTLTQGTDFNSVISGAGAVIQAGTGTTILNGVNTYTGATTVTAGTLQLTGSGSIASSHIIDVASGAFFDVSTVTGGYTLFAGQILKGGGTVTGPMTVAGTLSPGASIGTLTVTGDTTLSGTFSVDVNTIGGSDLLAVTGTGSDLTLGGVLSIADLSKLVYPVYTIATYTGTLSGSFASTNLGTTAYSVDTTSTPGSVLLVPEPATMALLALGGLGLILGRKRR